MVDAIGSHGGDDGEMSGLDFRFPQTAQHLVPQMWWSQHCATGNETHAGEQCNERDNGLAMHAFQRGSHSLLLYVTVAEFLSSGEANYALLKGHLESSLDPAGFSCEGRTGTLCRSPTSDFLRLDCYVTFFSTRKKQRTSHTNSHTKSPLRLCKSVATHEITFPQATCLPLHLRPHFLSAAHLLTQSIGEHVGDGGGAIVHDVRVGERSCSVWCNQHTSRCGRQCGRRDRVRGVQRARESK